MPYPGFPTDLQSPLLAAVCMSDGKSCIEERVFENRFLIVEHLRKMGANVCVIGQTAHVLPVDHLYGAILKAEDLRGGAALVLAALAGAVMITSYEFAVGCIVNLKMGWNVWDYSSMEGNLLGQICPVFTGVWFILCFLFLGLVRLLS